MAKKTTQFFFDESILEVSFASKENLTGAKETKGE
jgi:hypothetical protein